MLSELNYVCAYPLPEDAIRARWASSMLFIFMLFGEERKSYMKKSGAVSCVGLWEGPLAGLETELPLHMRPPYWFWQ